MPTQGFHIMSDGFGQGVCNWIPETAEFANLGVPRRSTAAAAVAHERGRTTRARMHRGHPSAFPPRGATMRHAAGHVERASRGLVRFAHIIDGARGFG